MAIKGITHNRPPRRWRLGLIITALTLSGCAQQFTPAPPEQRTEEIGLLLRREYQDGIRPGQRYIHLDVLYDGNRIAGYYPAHPGIKNALWGGPGVVFSLPELHYRRPQYLSANTAKNFHLGERRNLCIVTDWARFRVTPKQAQAFAREWEKLEAHPGYFHLIGHNCATRIADALRRSGIILAGIPRTDNPENLLRFLRRCYPDLEVATGFFGLDAAGHPQLEPVNSF